MRWRLKQKHYLDVPGTEWDYKETTNTGRQKRLVFNVPMYLDPDNPGDQNYPGEIIVSHAAGAHPKDIVFEGDPTPDMEPLDAEAEALSASFASKWQHPINSLGDGGYGEVLERSFEKMMLKMASATPAAPLVSPGPSMEQFEAMQKQVAALLEQNAMLKEAAGTEHVHRRA